MGPEAFLKCYEQQWELYLGSCLELSQHCELFNELLNETSHTLLKSKEVQVPKVSIWRYAVGLFFVTVNSTCLLYTSDAADDTPCVDLGGRRIIKKKKESQFKVNQDRTDENIV
eukprot:TRINITY_DN50284_c0_g1_i1.p1 TRINITY_DN50284_c0_g1~~TRINITY_DN50284_c0_g1_i1.p1  ORF type:complete len:114 (-),score=17.29 TRINITY_DN50284_c0_g1_i1:66-407(-)